MTRSAGGVGGEAEQFPVAAVDRGPSTRAEASLPLPRSHAVDERLLGASAVGSRAH